VGHTDEALALADVLRRALSWREKTCPTCQGRGKLRVRVRTGIPIAEIPKRLWKWAHYGTLSTSDMRPRDVGALLSKTKDARLVTRLRLLEADGMNRPLVLAAIDARIGELDG
jgi:hypothetical protein